MLILYRDYAQTQIYLQSLYFAESFQEIAKIAKELDSDILTIDKENTSEIVFVKIIPMVILHLLDHCSAIDP